MADPASTTAASAALTGVSLLVLFPGMDASAVLGAFAGAAVFVMSSKDFSTAKKLTFLLLAIIAGLVAGPFFTSLIDTVLPDRVDVPEGVGSLVASACVIKLLIWLIGKADHPDALLAFFKGNGK